jgi:hypothetical protein
MYQRSAPNVPVTAGFAASEERAPIGPLGTSQRLPLPGGDQRLGVPKVSQAVQRRDARCVKWPAPHSGQCWNASFRSFCAEIDPTCRSRSVASEVPQVFDVIHKSENMRSDLARCRLAHLGTCQAQPHSAQVLVYSVGCHGNRMERSSPHEGGASSACLDSSPTVSGSGDAA